MSSILIRSGTEPQKGLGAKANNLLQLVLLNYNVPQFVIIPQWWFQDQLPKAIIETTSADLLHEFSIPKGLINDIKTSFNSVTRHFAVRSSYALEDSKEQSFAGQFTSKLFVKPDQLEDAILEVWSSCLYERAKSYQKINRLDGEQYMSVIVQEMINADASGVAFSMNPITGHRTQHVINSVFGLGEGLVSGDLDSDQFFIHNGDITAQLSQKTHYYKLDTHTGSGITKNRTNQDSVSKPSLSNQDITRLYQIVNQLKEDFGYQVDVEFALKSNTLYVLQVRPITSYKSFPDKGGKHIVWDNSNIIESYPGITLPLTFSYIVDLYERAYIQFIEILGVSPTDVEKSKVYFANMLGLLNGRVYYNLRSWYKMISMLPGYSFNARFMEQMMGVKERFDMDDYVKISKLSDVFRVLKMIRNIVYNLISLERQKRVFTRTFDKMEAAYLNIDPDSLSLDKIMDEYLKREALILKIWKAPLLNDFYAMIFFGLVKKQISKLFGTGSALHNDLFIGDQTIITTQPAKMIANMVNMIFDSDELKVLFNTNKPEQIFHQIKTNNHYTAFDEAFTAYIEKFGERVVGELKLETITYKQDPLKLIEVLSSYIINKKKPIDYSSSKAHLDRELAEKQVKQKLKFHPIKRILFFNLLKKARKLISGRENLRLYRTRAFGGAREAFLKIGQLLAIEGKLHDARDVFYLRKAEIFSFIAGTSVDYDLKALVANRKQQFVSFANEPLQSERLSTYGAVPVGNSFYQQSETALLDGDLQGIGCCVGYVKGPVYVIEKPADAFEINGGILVTSSTDPGWVTIFPSVSGILVERGSLLSHVAIVAREMGIPCIVAVNGITARLKTGNFVEMDGAKGTVKIINNIE